MKKNPVFELFGSKILFTFMNLNNSKPCYLEQISISLECSRYRRSTVCSVLAEGVQSQRRVCSLSGGCAVLASHIISLSEGVRS